MYGKKSPQYSANNFIEKKLADRPYSKFFTVAISRKFAIKRSLNIPKDIVFVVIDDDDDDYYYYYYY